MSYTTPSLSGAETRSPLTGEWDEDDLDISLEELYAMQSRLRQHLDEMCHENDRFSPGRLPQSPIQHPEPTTDAQFQHLHSPIQALPQNMQQPQQTAAEISEQNVQQTAQMASIFTRAREQLQHPAADFLCQFLQLVMQARRRDQCRLLQLLLEPQQPQFQHQQYPVQASSQSQQCPPRVAAEILNLGDEQFTQMAAIFVRAQEQLQHPAAWDILEFLQLAVQAGQDRCRLLELLLNRRR